MADQTIGSACTTGAGSAMATYGGNNSWCNGTTWQFPAYQFGSSALSCTSSQAGTIQWTGSAFQGCNGTSWGPIDVSTSAALSSLLAATTTNSIDNGSWAQTWKWGTLTTQTALSLTSSSMTSGTLLSLSNSATASGAGTVLSVSNSEPGGLALAATGTSYFNGNVGIGTATPQSAVHIVSSDVNAQAYTVANQIGTTDTVYVDGELNAIRTTTTASQSIYGGFDYLVASPSAASAVGLTARQSEVVVPTSAFYGTSNNVYAIQGKAINQSNQSVGGLYGATFMGINTGVSTAGTVMAVQAFSGNILNSSSVIGSQYGVYAQSYNWGTITNGYGIYITGEGSGGTWINNPYDLYAADADAYNYFGGNVGIGTTSPQGLIDISGSLGSTRVATNGNQFGHFYNGETNARWQLSRDALANGQAGLEFGSGAGSALDTFIGRDGSGSLELQTGGNNNRLTITSAGNVGVGTTSPYGLIEAYGTDGQIHVRNANDTGSSFIGETYGTLYLGMYNPSGSAWGSVPAITLKPFFAITNGGKMGSVTNTYPNAASFRNILDDSSGNASFSGSVGIGTTSPSDKLDVAGAIGLTATTATLPTNGVYSPAAGQLALTTSGNAALTVTSTQSVGIGTATPAAKLHVAGGAVVGNDAAGCTSTNAGEIIWTGSAFEGCNGSSWQILSSVTAAYDLAVFMPNAPPANMIVRAVAERNGTFPAGLTGSGCVAKSGATSSATITVNQVHSGTTTAVATITFAASGGSNQTCTFTAASTITVVPGDVIEFVFPSTPDATLANIAITLAGSHT